MLLSEVLAQDGAIQTLKRAVQLDRLAQAYLFTGPSGVGKLATGLGLACARNCPEAPLGCGTCATCKRILSGQHPDVRVIAPRDEGNRNLPVEYIRQEILPFTKYAPFEARTAFILFPEADISFPKHHAEAANAILKTLEEPRANIVFLLQSARPSRLLTTIRSRCQKVRFGALPGSVVSTILKQAGILDAAAAAAIPLAAGQIDRALELATDGKAEAMFEWAVRIDQCTEHADAGRLLSAAEELSKHSELNLILDTLSLYYRDLAALGLDQQELVRFESKRSILTERSARISPGDAASRVASIDRLSEQLGRNANKEIALGAMLFGMS